MWFVNGNSIRGNSMEAISNFFPVENGNELWFPWFLYLGLLSQFPFFDLRGSTWGAAFAIACCLAP
jgi:hypothetical protein